MTDSSHSVLQSHRIQEVMVKVMIGQLKIVGNFFYQADEVMPLLTAL